jgi:hypothetical protein
MYQLMNGFRLSQLTTCASAAQLREQDRLNDQLGHPAHCPSDGDADQRAGYHAAENEPGVYSGVISLLSPPTALASIFRATGMLA